MSLKNMTWVDKRKLASNPTTSVYLLRELSRDMSINIRATVAANPSTPKKVLRTLSQDRDSYNIIRHGVALNPNTPEDVLRELVKDDEYSITVVNVAGNPSTPDDVLRDLLKDGDLDVMYTLTKNTKSSVGLLMLIFEHVKTDKDVNMDLIRSLYYNDKFPVFAKRVIETLFGERLEWI